MVRVILLLCVEIITIGTCTVVGDSGWTCDVEGTRYKDGENFTISRSGPCVTYQCANGGARVINTACRRDGRCINVGETWTSHCLTYQCHEEKGLIGIKIVKGGCMVSGTCLGVDKIFTQGCFNYTCQQRDHRLGPTFRLLLKEWGCSYGGKCVAANYTVTNNCVTQMCDERNGSVGMYDVHQGCALADKSCLEVGQTMVEKCRTYKCSIDNFLGLKVFSVKPVSALCEDADGKCRGEGVTFPMRFNNDIMHDCTCTLDGYNPHVSCGKH